SAALTRPSHLLVKQVYRKAKPRRHDERRGLESPCYKKQIRPVAWSPADMAAAGYSR
mgnify:CR=1